MHIISYHFIIIYSQPSPSILPGIVPVKRRPKTRFRRGRPKWKRTSDGKEKAGSGWAGLGIRGRHKTGNDYGGIRGQGSGKVRICFVFYCGTQYMKPLLPPPHPPHPPTPP